MQKTIMVTGQIIPERRAFGHDGLKLFIKDLAAGIDTTLIFSVMDNQFIAKVVGDVGDQSNVMIKHMVSQAERIVLNAMAYTNGSVFDLDVIGVIHESHDKSNESVNFHYMDNVHDIIKNRHSAFEIKEIWQLCISDDGLPLRRCLNDLRMALKELNDSPFYCYRAIETTKYHIGTRFGETKDKKQWEATRSILQVEKAEINIIKNLADDLRHGKSVSYDGSEWRNIISITWDIVELYIKYLQEIEKGTKKWPES